MRPPPPASRAVLAVACALTATAVAALGAQDAPPRRWTGSVQANGSILFGNTDQRVLGGRGALTRADSLIEVDVGVQALYGDAQTEDGDRQVTKRLWIGTLSADYRAAMRTSPFVFGSVESSLEKRLAARSSVGVGAKQTFVRTERREVSLSVALLDEQTRPLDPPAGAGGTRITRWSVRGRLRHSFDDRLRLSHVTFWQPSVTALARYLVRSSTEIDYALREGLGLSLALLDNYDSEARARGARVNNDGQLLFGVSARW
ncbi:MAG: DUF481 domain-containing protein [Gemmatirosa sp.]